MSLETSTYGKGSPRGVTPFPELGEQPSTFSRVHRPLSFPVLQLLDWDSGMGSTHPGSIGEEVVEGFVGYSGGRF